MSNRIPGASLYARHSTRERRTVAKTPTKQSSTNPASRNTESTNYKGLFDNIKIKNIFCQIIPPTNCVGRGVELRENTCYLIKEKGLLSKINNNS